MAGWYGTLQADGRTLLELGFREALYAGDVLLASSPFTDTFLRVPYGQRLLYDPITQTAVLEDRTTLPFIKQAAFDAIDARTDQLIQNGFTYAGKTFSLSTTAQTKWLGLVLAKDAPSMTYPYTVSALDESSYSIADGNEVVTIYGTIIATVSTLVAGGKALKDAVFAAADAPGVAAVIDNR